MKVLIIGSGLIGLTTAYSLIRRGCEVTVLEREEGPARQTSFANAALLTPSMADPWNAPGSWRVLLSSLGRSDSPMQLRVKALPGLMRWGLGFLADSRADRYERNSLSNLRLALYSLGVMQVLRQETNLKYGASARGALRIFRTDAALNQAVDLASRRQAHGLRFRRLLAAETVVLEPALKAIAGELAGAVHYESDETGDAYQFCVALTQYLRAHGIEFRFGTGVRLEVQRGKVKVVLRDGDRLEADCYVVAGGCGSARLLRQVGIRLPVQPVKGYSITFGSHTALRIPVVDDDYHAAVVPLNGKLRIGGTAEFAGFDRTLDPMRVQNLMGLLHKVLPEERRDPMTGTPWCGLRPVSMDGVPIIGPTTIPNLWVNAGHGHLGWTMAAGSGELLSDLLRVHQPAIDPTPYALARFG